MAPAMRSMLALCAPAAITAFVVNPGSVFRSAATGVPAVNTASPKPAGSSSSPSLNRAAIGAQVRWPFDVFILGLVCGVGGIWYGTAGVRYIRVLLHSRHV